MEILHLNPTMCYFRIDKYSRIWSNYTWGAIKYTLSARIAYLKITSLSESALLLQKPIFLLRLLKLAIVFLQMICNLDDDICLLWWDNLETSSQLRIMRCATPCAVIHTYKPPLLWFWSYAWTSLFLDSWRLNRHAVTASLTVRKTQSCPTSSMSPDDVNLSATSSLGFTKAICRYNEVSLVRVNKYTYIYIYTHTVLTQF